MRFSRRPSRWISSTTSSPGAGHPVVHDGQAEDVRVRGPGREVLALTAHDDGRFELEIELVRMKGLDHDWASTGDRLVVREIEDGEVVVLRNHGKAAVPARR